MNPMGTVEDIRRAWEIANRKYVVESDSSLRIAEEGTLLSLEIDAIAPLVGPESVVVHLQSGNGTEDPVLSQLAGSTVVGLDFSAEAAGAAQHRARLLGTSVAYVVADALRVPLAPACVDLVYTGKGALMWLPELPTWAAEIARLLKPGGWVFIYDAHPVAALWTTDTDAVRVRSDRSYFGGTRLNDSFPASAIERFAPDSGAEAIEWQWTLADVVNAVLDAGLRLDRLGEHPEPFWRPTDAGTVAAWAGNVPNSMSLLATKPA
jgi:SAM-dependent methyltransferase